MSRKFVGWGDAGTPTAFRIRGGGACTCCMARFVVGVHSAGHPDALHLHQLIYQRLARIAVGSQNPTDQTRRNSGVAPYVWLGTTLFIVLAIVFWDSTPWLLGLAALFVASYAWLYLRLIRWRAPAWMVRNNPAQLRP